MPTTRDRINQIGEVLVKDIFVEKKVRNWNSPEIAQAKPGAWQGGRSLYRAADSAGNTADTHVARAPKAHPRSSLGGRKKH